MAVHADYAKYGPAPEVQHLRHSERETFYAAQRTAGHAPTHPSADQAQHHVAYETPRPSLGPALHPAVDGVPIEQRYRPTGVAMPSPSELTPHTHYGPAAANTTPMHSARGSPASQGMYTPPADYSPQPPPRNVTFSDDVRRQVSYVDDLNAYVTLQPPPQPQLHPVCHASPDVASPAAQSRPHAPELVPVGRQPMASPGAVHPQVAEYLDMQRALGTRVAEQTRREGALRDLRDDVRFLREEVVDLRAKRDRAMQSTVAARELLTKDEQAALARPYPAPDGGYSTPRARGIEADINAVGRAQAAIHDEQRDHHRRCMAQMSREHSQQMQQLEDMYRRPRAPPGAMLQDSPHARALQCQANVKDVEDKIAALMVSGRHGPATPPQSGQTKAVRFAV